MKTANIQREKKNHNKSRSKGRKIEPNNEVTERRTQSNNIEKRREKWAPSANKKRQFRCPGSNVLFFPTFKGKVSGAYAIFSGEWPATAVMAKTHSGKVRYADYLMKIIEMGTG